MLSTSKLFPTIPVTDIERSKNFYQNILGFSVLMGDMYGVMFSVGDCELYIYQRGPSKADHTLASFQVEDIEKEIAELTQKGVKFEHYDMPNIKTDEKGIAITPPVKAAWFKDPDGNILGLTQLIK